MADEIAAATAAATLVAYQLSADDKTARRAATTVVVGALRGKARRNARVGSDRLLQTRLEPPPGFF